MNHTTIRGNIVRDPDISLAGTRTVMKFAVAIQAKLRKDDDKKYISFIDVEYWPIEYGENVKNEVAKLRKGLPVFFDAEIQQDRWEKDGQKYSKVKLVVDGWVNVEQRGNQGAFETVADQSGQKESFDPPPF